ncbi:MAG: hypothetical protein WCJ11_11370 [Methylococcaceae bacterium]
MKTNKDARWSAQIARIGNQAVREAQAKNRELGIVNWYSLNGRIVNDAINSNEVSQQAADQLGK